MTYIVQADLENRLSVVVVRQILDDNLDGTPDANPLTRVIVDAESYVESFLRGNYDLAAIRALGVGAPNEIKRLCLDVAVSYLWDRHPEYIRADGAALLKRAHEELMQLRRTDRRLDVVATPEPPENQQFVIRSGNPDDQAVETKVFLDKGALGIF